MTRIEILRMLRAVDVGSAMRREERDERGAAECAWCRARRVDLLILAVLNQGAES